jgi:hypothetical protein
MSYNLFLDDYRQPIDCLEYMHPRMGNDVSIYETKEWTVCPDYNSFTETIINKGLPDLISFDHDLAPEHYTAFIKEENYREKTGMDCAKWLSEYCINNALPLPNYYVHSMNPVGTKNIDNFLKNHLRYV